MKIFSFSKIAGASLFALTLSIPSLAVGATDQSTAESQAALVYRVSHSIASSKLYTKGAPAGFKWSKRTQQPAPEESWAGSTRSRAGYKWGTSEASDQSPQETYAENSNYQWSAMSFSEQSAYRWGLRSFADQSAYRWGLRSFADQSAYRWGLRSFADQSAYRWGLR